MNGPVKRPINHLKITLMEKEQVFTAFEEMLSGESGEIGRASCRERVCTLV